MKLIDSNRYYLQGTNNTWLHIATVQDSLREFMCFAQVSTLKIYIEEITGGGGPYFIEDQSLAQAIHDFLVDRGVLDMSKPLLPDDKWYRPKRK